MNHYRFIAKTLSIKNNDTGSMIYIPVIRSHWSTGKVIAYKERDEISGAERFIDMEELADIIANCNKKANNQTELIIMFGRWQKLTVEHVEEWNDPYRGH